MKTVTANIPARKMTYSGKTTTYAAYTKVFTQDDAGAWKMGKEALFEAEVIDVCQDATNWADIKAAHFPMHGFHS